MAKYNITPKPTLYNGRKFRSRLEARWQYTFDRIGWDAQYEPSEINGRNPDFIIKCSTNTCYPVRFIIVEVKPAIMLTQEYLDGILRDYDNVPAHLLILDEFPFEKTSLGNYIKIGLGAQAYEHGKTEIIDIEMKNLDDIGSSYMSYDGMIYGTTDRENFLCPNLDYRDWVALKHIWIESANATMFLPV